ncbi:MAG: aminotransferase class V-fold PLP-dependent enzyme, partial [Candidatus Eremiobacteraeota bacterium]|nr:aminotransferase class V-fold PLP-dependent enzyme [Candidatus Eremiobacteraeota bacterium]
EANALALWGTMRLAPAGAHLLYSAVEHPAVRDYAQSLESLGYSVEAVPVDNQGRVDPLKFAALLRPETALVSVMATNNEVGTRQPIPDLAALCHEHGTLLHVDAVQEPLKASCGADLMTLSGHKLGGVPAGCLYLRQGLRVAPMLIGGAQEDSRRAGTPNLIAAASLALVLGLRSQAEQSRVRALREQLEERLSEVAGSHLLGGGTDRADHISAWLFEDVPAEPMLARLDLSGLAASSGSACSSHSIEPSKVLLSMGYSDVQASGLIRFSLGWATTSQEIDEAARLVEQAVDQVRLGRKGKVA